jgi:hypothetical protein
MHDTSADEKDRKLFSQNLKRVVANREMHIRAMYREGMDVPWHGRVIVTMNDDAESLLSIPHMDITIKDKLLLLKGFDPKTAYFPTDDEIRAELPYFGAWLRDHVIPDELKELRFGVKAWAHPELLEAARAESGTAIAQEILDAWRKTQHLDTKKEWVGTITELFSELRKSEPVQAAATSAFRSPEVLGRAIAKIIQTSEVDWVRKGQARRGGAIPERLIFVRLP